MLTIPGQDPAMLIVFVLVVVAGSSDVLQYVWANWRAGTRLRPMYRHAKRRKVSRVMSAIERDRGVKD